MGRRHYNTFNNINTNNLGIDLLVRVEEGEQNKLLHLCRMNRRNMPNKNVGFCRFQINWGDGQITTVDVTPLYTTSSQPTSFTHTYTTAGDYNINITQLTDNTLTRPYWFTFTVPSGLYQELRLIEIKRFIFNGISLKQLIGGSINPNTLEQFNKIYLYETTNLNSMLSVSSKFKKLDVKGISKTLISPLTDLNGAFRLYKYPYNINELTDNWDISQVTTVEKCFSGSQEVIGYGQTFIDRLPIGVAGNPYTSAYLFEDCKKLSDYNSIDNLYKDNY